MMHRSRRLRGAIRRSELVLGTLIAAMLAFAVVVQSTRFDGVDFKYNLYRQRLKLPPVDVIRFATLGYDNVYSDWLWLQSIQAFGSGWITEDGTTGPIFNYFDVLTDVDPGFISAYRFANLIIADNRRDFVLGTEILRKGVHKNPMDFNIPYLGIYNGIWQYDGDNDARWFAIRLDRIPNAPGFMRRLAEYIERKAGRLEVAYEFNVRYYLEYLLKNNQIEREIVVRRVQDLLDRWYRRELSLAIGRYYEANGDHPSELEDVITPEYLPPFDAPTPERFLAATEQITGYLQTLSPDRPIPEEAVAAFIRLSTERIVGLPPEPMGTWYLIFGGAVEYLRATGGKLAPGTDDVSYLRSAKELIESINQTVAQAQMFIMDYYRTNNGALPTDAELGRFQGRDPLGGHYVYQRVAPESPVYGVFYSTATRRIIDGKEPRMGIRGPGPFPGRLQPRLSEHEVDRQWAIENGYMDQEGNEVWFLPGKEPWNQPERDGGEVPVTY